MAIGEGLLLYSIGGVLLLVAIGMGIREYRTTKKIVSRTGAYKTSDT